MVAADTFIYVGELGKVFSAVARALGRGGFFAFSVEDLERSSMRSAVAMAAPGQTGADIASEQTVRDRKGVCHVVVEDEVVGAVPGWGAQLLTSTRFAHSAAYIDLLGLLHGLRTISCRSAVLRSEGSSPVYGIMYVLQRVCHAD